LGKTKDVFVSNKNVKTGNTKIKTKDGRVGWGGSSFNKKYEWEDKLLVIIRDCIKNDITILPVVREKLSDKYKVSDKSWKNRITEMKRKYRI
jgi:hypothetical protein